MNFIFRFPNVERMELLLNVKEITCTSFIDQFQINF